jgi:hypothetical protein
MLLELKTARIGVIMIFFFECVISHEYTASTFVANNIITSKAAYRCNTYTYMLHSARSKGSWLTQSNHKIQKNSVLKLKNSFSLTYGAE